MAVYVSPDDLRTRLVALGPSTRTAAALDEDQLKAAVSDAQIEVDLALSGRYQPPGDPVPSAVASLTVQVAIYLATLAARGSSDLADQDPVALRYKRVRAMLDAIAAGKVDVPGLEPPEDEDGTTSAYGIDTVPAMGLGQDVAAPTYDGQPPEGWPGGPPATGTRRAPGDGLDGTRYVSRRS